ncbi:MOSC N-terminal beta barrel domain-containing protein [Thermopolyspora sp. NPDC052614]|uniref:MOSC domain-containing protein n=1 Tax=Thermopolyspora sp. NPDC052614 TaxID=3155682 RepID=UPI00342BA8A6
MRLGSIHIYPIKSTRGMEVASAVVEPWGLAGDRRYMVVDAAGEGLTARTHPKMLAVTATPEGSGLKLSGPHAPPLRLSPAPGTPTRRVRIWRDDVDAIDTGDEAATWFTDLLGLPVRLVWLNDATRRPVNPKYGTADDRVSFADAFPLLLASAASLRQLNDWIAEEAVERGGEPPAPLPMRRFRPSIVVEDAPEPFAEDHWRRVRVGDVPFRAVKLCDRCVLTTIDPDTYTKGKEPLRTLARHRRWDGKVWFAVNLIPDSTGTISVGDPVIPEE